MLESELAGCPVLVDTNIGFSVPYLRQLRNRVFRTSCSFQGEACTILMTWPDEAPVGEKQLERLLINAFLMYCAWEQGYFSRFNIEDPSPDDYTDGSNTGLFTVFFFLLGIMTAASMVGL